MPIIGHLFRSDANSSDKTELVILVTPKIISDTSDWGRIQNSFIKALDNISFE
jgi:general secretion pathway protein D